MGNPNEYRLLKGYLSKARVPAGRVLNCGVAHGDNMPYADLFPGRQLVGIDIEAGPGVIVCDIEGDCSTLAGERFAMVLCCSVLEHTRRPWVVAQNLERLVAPGGVLYVTVPWAWRVHRYPIDFWRMSVEGLQSLFSPSISWERCAYITQTVGEILGVADEDHDRRGSYNGDIFIRTQMACVIGRASGSTPNSGLAAGSS